VWGHFTHSPKIEIYKKDVGQREERKLRQSENQRSAKLTRKGIKIIGISGTNRQNTIVAITKKEKEKDAFCEVCEGGQKSLNVSIRATGQRKKNVDIRDLV